MRLGSSSKAVKANYVDWSLPLPNVEEPQRNVAYRQQETSGTLLNSTNEPSNTPNRDRIHDAGSSSLPHIGGSPRIR
jgi:hypothetical protein